MPRRPRFDHGRNLQNLRVIPTSKSAPIVNKSLAPIHQVYTVIENQVIQHAVVPIPAQNQGLVTPSLVADLRPNQPLPSTSTPRPVQNQFKYQQNPHAFPAVNDKPPRPFRRRRNRKNRRRNMQEMPYDHWYDSYNLKQVDPVTEDFEKIADVSELKVENAAVPEVKMEDTSENTPKVENVSEAKVENVPEENYFEEVEVASVEGETKEEVLVGYRKTKRQYLSSRKRKCFFRPKIFNLGERTFVNCLNMHDEVDVDVVSEAEYEYENDNLDKNESQEEKLVPVKESEVKVETGKVSAKNGEVPKTVLRKYKACVKSSKKLTQGECLIQSSLDTWKSHLLGLEYLIEIQNEKKDAQLKYHCILCDSDVSFKGLPAIYVMNHVNDRKHVVRYLEKHFSAYGFKFAENNRYHVDALKKIAEEVNHKSGYYFMCVTTSAHYAKSERDFKKRIESAYHPNEKDVKLDEALVEKALNFSLEEIQTVLSDVIDKVVATAIDKSRSHFKKATSLEGTDGMEDYGKKSEISKFQLKKKKLNTSKYSLIGKARFSRHFQAKRAFSSYLKSKYAKVAMQKKPFKVFSSHLNKVSSSNKSSEMDPDEMDSSQVVVEDSTIELSVEKAFEVDAEVSQTSVGESVGGDTDSKETEVHSSECDSSQHAHKNREKIPLKATTTVHSKHCRKRILGKENCRSKLASKTSTKEELTSDVSDKLNDNCKSVSCSSDHTSRKVTKRHDSRSTQKKSSPHRHLSVHKVSKDLKSLGEKHSSSHHRNTSKKNVEESSSLKQIKVTKDSPSEWRPIGTTKSLAKSPTSGASPLSKSPPRKNVKKRSKSPIKRIKSPLRHVKEPLKNSGTRHSRSPSRRKSKSPIWKPTFQSGLQGTRSPFRRKSRSPLWKPSRSPIRRKSRSPRRRFSRSPGKRYSRSPVRHRSRTPISRRQSKSPKRRYSRSPRRRHSRSPVRQHSRSPVRRHSRSPMRRRSRSPVKRRSRSPIKRRSRSPVKRRSRSPVKRRSRSPVRQYSRSPVRRYSRSPIRKHSRSPLRRYSRSPIKRRSRSPMHTLSKSPPKYRSLRESISPDRRQGRFNSPSHMYSYNKLSDSKSEFSKIRETSKILNEMEGVRSKYKYSLSSTHGIGDLDPVSDEDESVYFNDKHQADVGSSSTKMVLAKLLQKFSMADVKPNDPAVNKLMQFMESHSSEIQELMGSHSKSGNTSASKVDTDLLGRNLLLQQYLLSNLAGFNQATAVASNLSSNFPQQSFLQALPGFGLNISPNVPTNVVPNMPTNVAPNIPPNVAPNIPPNVPSSIPTNIPPPNVSQPVQRFFPPNINVPPPQIFHQPNQPPRQNFPPKPNVPPEVMFKDLKATVNKLFGANEVVMKQEKIKPQVPGYVTEPDPEKWDLNHPDTQKFNPSIASKNMFQPHGKNIDFGGGMPKNLAREEIPMFNNNNNNPGQFFPGRGMNRSQMQNVQVPPPDAKVSFCDVSRGSKGNLFPVVNSPLVNPNFGIDPRACGGVSDHKLSLAQRLASVLVKFGMIDVPAPLLQEMLMKIGAFSSSPRQDINESEIVSILKRLGYLT